MPISLADLYFAVALKEMSDENFLLAWHEEVANEASRIIVVESAATHRFGLSTWHHRYARSHGWLGKTWSSMDKDNTGRHHCVSPLHAESRRSAAIRTPLNA
jgi:hypothetical protein